MSRRQPETVRSAASAAQERAMVPQPTTTLPRSPIADESRPRGPAARATVEPFGLTADQGCDLLQVRSTTFYELLKSDPTFPRPRYVGSMTRWLRDELEAWLRAQTEQQMRARK